METALIGDRAMDRPLCVIHLDDGDEWRGGQFQVSLLAEGLAGFGVRQMVMTRPDSPLHKKLSSNGIDVSPVDFKGELDRRAPRLIAGHAREVEADILHAHTAHTHTLALRALRLINRAKRKRLTHLVITRRVDFPVGRGFFSRRKYRRPDQFFIAISEEVLRVLIDGGVEPDRIAIVPSGVPAIPPEQALSRSEVRKEFGIAEDAIAIVSVGALTDHKGHRWLIDAAAEVVKAYPKAHFWILGEGELRGALEDQIAELGVRDCVSLPGYVPDARLKLAGFDLYVSSSRLEGMGTSILDAMRAGLPVVAAAAGGVTDIIRQGVTGWLVPPRSGRALAGEIVNVIQGPDEPRRIVVDRARNSAEVNFSAERMVEGTLNVYRRLTGAASSEFTAPVGP